MVSKVCTRMGKNTAGWLLGLSEGGVEQGYRIQQAEMDVDAWFAGEYVTWNRAELERFVR